MNEDLEIVDKELRVLLREEKDRQLNGIELIASENFVSKAVLQALGSCATNKYSEGLPFKRYYGGNQVIDKIEQICIDRALKAFDLDPEKWGVNVQPYSGSPANFEVFTALVGPGGRIMGLDLPSGGHLSHGYRTKQKSISAVSTYFSTMPYTVDGETGLIDYDQLQKNASLFHPQVIVAGGSAYPRDWDYKRMREIADKEGCFLVCDMAHISGIVAAKECNNPFDFCDVVTSTTHKTLRGPRGGIIFFRKGVRSEVNGKKELYDLENKINFAVFPGHQGGPHENTIAAIAVALKEVMQPEFKNYIKQVKLNSHILSESLKKHGYSIVTGGTDNHLLLWDLRPQKLTGDKLEKLLEKIEISANKNTIYGDTSALYPGGIRLGTPAMTTRGLKETDFEKVAEFLHKAVEVALKIVESVGNTKSKDFLEKLETWDITSLKNEVHQFASKFFMPGFTDI
eukprot:TRINITY_DN1997_c0_g1_i1.p1 TRINITY_DN1997_c0_g1~~TRINITY_DN1997_c0_g1_i1.p1  ORF type:complete len:456 (+),score=125.58 TRINITY_DN1997_c0_g1_i1:391-1758(+)